MAWYAASKTRAAMELSASSVSVAPRQAWWEQPGEEEGDDASSRPPPSPGSVSLLEVQGAATRAEAEFAKLRDVLTDGEVDHCKQLQKGAERAATLRREVRALVMEIQAQRAASAPIAAVATPAAVPTMQTAVPAPEAAPVPAPVQMPPQGDAAAAAAPSGSAVRRAARRAAMPALRRCLASRCRLLFFKASCMNLLQRQTRYMLTTGSWCVGEAHL